MSIQRNVSRIGRIGWSVLFGLAAAFFGMAGAVATGAGFIFLLPGIVVGLGLGLIPFEGEEIGLYFLIAAAINFLFYTGCFYCVSFTWMHRRTKNA